MQKIFETLSTATALAALATLAALLTITAAGVLNASERRAEYLEAESAYFECIESGLDRSECVQGVGL